MDFVLFNGGTLHSAVVRQRLLEQVAAWQGGTRPMELENSEPDLAVARGAARYGKLLRGHSGRIAAGAARAVFLQVQTTQAAMHQTVPPALVCVLPRNASPEHVFEIDLPGLEVRTDQTVEVPESSFVSPQAFVFLYERQLFLTIRDRQVVVWDFRGDLVARCVVCVLDFCRPRRARSSCCPCVAAQV